MVRLLAVFALLLTTTACGDDVGNEGRTVGGPCATNVDCSSESRCLTGGDFAGGTCVVNCNSHEDCPFGARCISKESGVCLLACEVPADCRGGYNCEGESNNEGGGDSLVCVSD
jgi:hypothetical protein